MFLSSCKLMELSASLYQGDRSTRALYQRQYSTGPKQEAPISTKIQSMAFANRGQAIQHTQETITLRLDIKLRESISSSIKRKSVSSHTVTAFISFWLIRNARIRLPFFFPLPFYQLPFEYRQHRMREQITHQQPTSQCRDVRVKLLEYKGLMSIQSLPSLVVEIIIVASIAK